MAKKKTKQCEWLTVKEARERLGVSDMTVRRLIERGTLQWRNLGVNKTEVLGSDVDELLKPKRAGASS